MTLRWEADSKSCWPLDMTGKNRSPRIGISSQVAKAHFLLTMCQKHKSWWNVLYPCWLKEVLVKRDLIWLSMVYRLNEQRILVERMTENGKGNDNNENISQLIAGSSYYTVRGKAWEKSQADEHSKQSNTVPFRLQMANLNLSEQYITLVDKPHNLMITAPS